MISKLLTIAAIAILLVSGCNEEQCRPSAWLLSTTDYDSPDNEITGRLGVVNPQGIEMAGAPTTVNA